MVRAIHIKLKNSLMYMRVLKFTLSLIMVLSFSKHMLSSERTDKFKNDFVIESNDDNNNSKKYASAKERRIVADAHFPGGVYVMGDTVEAIQGIHVFNSLGHEIKCFATTNIQPNGMTYLHLNDLPKGKYEMVLSGLKTDTIVKFYVNHHHRIVQLWH